MSERNRLSKYSGAKIDYAVVVRVAYVPFYKLKETGNGLKLKQEGSELSSKIFLKVGVWNTGMLPGRLWNFFLWQVLKTKQTQSAHLPELD